VSEIPPWERNELLPDGGSRITDALHQLAVAMPDATAGEDATTTMTFAELERRTNQIANTIASRSTE
jgi:non-ribosomal peptide synthetase component F